MVAKYGISYSEFINQLKLTSLNHPFVNDFLFNQYKINETGNLKYAAIIYIQRAIIIGNNVTTINFDLAYVDLLTQNRDNRIEIISVGTQVLTEIFNAIKYCDNEYDIDSNTSLTINPFSQHFADGTNGVIANITIQMRSNIGRCKWICKDINCNECE